MVQRTLIAYVRHVVGKKIVIRVEYSLGIRMESVRREHVEERPGCLTYRAVPACSVYFPANFSSSLPHAKKKRKKSRLPAKNTRTSTSLEARLMNAQEARLLCYNKFPLINEKLPSTRMNTAITKQPNNHQCFTCSPRVRTRVRIRFRTGYIFSQCTACQLPGVEHVYPWPGDVRHFQRFSDELPGKPPINATKRYLNLSGKRLLQAMGSGWKHMRGEAGQMDKPDLGLVYRGSGHE